MRVVRRRVKREHKIDWGIAFIDPWNDRAIQDAFRFAMRLYRRFRRSTAEARIKSAIRIIDYQISEFGKDMERCDREAQKKAAKEKEEQERAALSIDNGIPFTDDDIPF